LLAVGTNLDIVKHFLRDSEYWVGLPIVPILLLAYLFNGVYYNMTVWFKITDRTHYATIITVFGAVVTIVANYILIPIAGYMGSSWATLICYFSITTLCYLLGQKFYPIPYNIPKSLAYIIVTTLLVYAVNAVFLEEQYLATTFHVIVLLAYMTVVYFIEKKDLRSLTN
jgi:O-antigen/teichoic acid export membrane protein